MKEEALRILDEFKRVHGRKPATPEEFRAFFEQRRKAVEVALGPFYLDYQFGGGWLFCDPADLGVLRERLAAEPDFWKRLQIVQAFAAEPEPSSRRH
jgi:hypothetical protein